MIWICFTDERLSSLIVVCDEEGISADEYEDILYDDLFSFVDDLLEIPEDDDEVRIADEKIFLFLQDNASCYKATNILEFLEENHVPVMKWSSQSPDLNSIENLWIDFKVRFHKWFIELFNRPSKSMEAKYRHSEILQKVWYDQGMKLIETFIKSMSRRCQAMIDAKDGWTKY